MSTNFEAFRWDKNFSKNFLFLRSGLMTRVYLLSIPTLMKCVLHASMQVYLVVEEFMYYFGYSKFFSINEAQLPLSKTGPELGDLGKVETNTDSLLLL